MTQKKKSNKVNKTFTKTVLPTDDVYIQFSDEEIKEFGWEKGQKFEFKTLEDGSVQLIPFVKMEINLEDWPVEILHMLIKESCDKDISVNDVINNTLKKALIKDID
jgi:hypothetical protein